MDMIKLTCKLSSPSYSENNMRHVCIGIAKGHGRKSAQKLLEAQEHMYLHIHTYIIQYVCCTVMTMVFSGSQHGLKM